MRNADFAVLVLSLVTSQERAAAIAGDLLESDDAATRLRFWFAVVRTAGAQLCRQIAAAPFGMVRAAILAMCLEFGFLALAAAAMFVILLSALSVARVMFHADLPEWVFRSLPDLLSNLAVPFVLGRWIFGRYHGREAAGILTLAAFHAAINLGVGLILWQLARTGSQAHAEVTVMIRMVDWEVSHTLVWAAYYLTLYPSLAIAGAASARAKSLGFSGNQCS